MERMETEGHTHTVEDKLRKLNILSWLQKVRLNQWRLAARVASHCSSRWTRRAVDWDPGLHFDSKSGTAQRR